MNDLSMLDPDETLAVKHCATADLKWRVMRCISCLLTEPDIKKVWKYTHYDTTTLADDDSPALGLVVARQDFYQHLVEVHGFPAEFADRAARRLK